MKRIAAVFAAMMLVFLMNAVPAKTEQRAAGDNAQMQEESPSMPFGDPDRLLVPENRTDIGKAACPPADPPAPDDGDDVLSEPDTRDENNRKETKEMKMRIGDTPVQVEWENNPSVDALRELAGNGLTVRMSMYGGFEQVGSIGCSLPRQDVQTVTASGDIVLYSGSQLVVFYASNSWSYTRLGRITDQSEQGMRELLGHGDVTITLTAE